MTQLLSALKGESTPEMETVARHEGMDIEHLMNRITKGTVVIPANINHKDIEPIGIGQGLSTKVNSNIGTSPNSFDIKSELLKTEISIKTGADTIMDLSTGGDLRYVRKKIMELWKRPIGTVPIYQAAVEAKGSSNITIENFLNVFEEQAKDGVDFATIHAGITKEAIPLIKKRLLGVVSRGGSFLVRWMMDKDKENPLYEHFDDILDIALEYDVTMSLGDGLRPGCIEDATDEAQLHELKNLGELVMRCRERGVQVMVEGPGHVPINEIQKNIELAKEYCHKAPFYVLGPLPTDIAAGYDHIVCAVGGALSCYYGADFLCYVTPKEHVGLPDVEDVREGIIASKIAAHIADIGKGVKGSRIKDRNMSIARRDMKWNEMADYVIDPVRFRKLRKEECERNPHADEYCSMCGEFCAIKTYKGD